MTWPVYTTQTAATSATSTLTRTLAVSTTSLPTNCKYPDYLALPELLQWKPLTWRAPLPPLSLTLILSFSSKSTRLKPISGLWKFGPHWPLEIVESDISTSAPHNPSPVSMHLIPELVLCQRHCLSLQCKFAKTDNVLTRRPFLHLLHPPH